MVDQQREAFEATYRDVHGQMDARFDQDVGCYLDPDVDSDWGVWKAAWNSALPHAKGEAEKISVLRGELVRERDYRLRAEAQVDYLKHRLGDEHASVWYWQGDGYDNLDSLVSSVTVAIRADDLRHQLGTPQVAVPEKVRELIGAVRSVNRSRQHSIHIEGDDEPCFWQRAEWVRYVLELADEAEQTITAAPTAPAREPISSDDLVPVPRGLLGAACSAICRTGPSDKVLAELRRYTTGDLSRPTAPAGEKLTPYEHRVNGWMMECFGPEISSDIEERNHRFLEESLELVQSTGCTAEAAHRLVDYVFGRPVGEPFQEVGGVRVTLAALCLANGINGEAAAEAELARITQPEMVERIREKQKRKPAFGPLPGVYPERAEQSAGDPDGLPERVLMPRALTAENGAKTALMGEFDFSVTMTCPECHPDEPNPDCEVCAGSVEYEQPHSVPWATIKRIYSAAVDLLSAPAPDEREIAALLERIVPRIDPQNPKPLDESEHCCECTLYYERERIHGEIARRRAGKARAGRLLDGQQHDGFPAAPAEGH